jgi:hypothetical protein
MMFALYWYNYLTWICIVLVQWNYSPLVDMLLHSDTLCWFLVSAYKWNIIFNLQYGIYFNYYHWVGQYLWWRTISPPMISSVQYSDLQYWHFLYMYLRIDRNLCSVHEKYDVSFVCTHPFRCVLGMHILLYFISVPLYHMHHNHEWLREYYLTLNEQFFTYIT